MTHSYIGCELAPNSRPQDTRLAASLMRRPWRWKRGQATTQLEQWFTTQFAATGAYGTDSGRTAITLLLDAVNIPRGKQVAIQAFTCMVVPNAIGAAGLIPTYVDIDSSWNLDPIQLEAALTGNPEIAAVMVQHTFGQPADMDPIVALCKKYNVVLLEDCAHALGVRYKGKLVGSFGAGSIFSFGRDKVVSSVSGGMVIANTGALANRLQQLQSILPYPGILWIKQRLLHAIIFPLARRWYYRWSIGKLLITASRLLHFIPLVVTAAEKSGMAPAGQRLPNAMASLALQQCQDLENLNHHRRALAATYQNDIARLPTVRVQESHDPAGAVPLRWALTVPQSGQLLVSAQSQRITFGTWYRTVIAPAGCDQQAAGYTSTSCPQAEAISRDCINLPTALSTSLADAGMISRWLKTTLMNNSSAQTNTSQQQRS